VKTVDSIVILSGGVKTEDSIVILNVVCVGCGQHCDIDWWCEN
jgi:fructose-bisphosphate aldolase class 1